MMFSTNMGAAAVANTVVMNCEAVKPSAYDAARDVKIPGWFAAGIVRCYGKDLVAAAKNGEINEVSGREREIDEAFLRVCHGLGCSLVGESATTAALVEGLACRIAKGNVPDDFKDMKIVKVDMQSLTKGEGYGGDPKVGAIIRRRALLEYAKEHPNVIMFFDIDELRRFEECYDFLKTLFARMPSKFIVAVTPVTYNKDIRPDPALRKRFGRLVRLYDTEYAVRTEVARKLGRLVNVLGSYNVHVKFGENVVDRIASKMFAEKQGALGIKRRLREVFDKVRSGMTKGEISPASEIELKEKDGEITFEVKADGRKVAEAKENVKPQQNK